MRHRETYKYIEGGKRQTKTYQAREVCDRASPDHSHEINETSGMNLTQEERRSNGIGSGMSVDVGNRLDTRKGKGRRSVGSGMRRLDARESKCSGVHC